MAEHSSDSGECCVGQNSGGDTIDLNTLESQTLDILQRFGSPSGKNVRRFGPPISLPSKRTEKARPWTGASAIINRSCRTTGGKVAGSRPLTSISRNINAAVSNGGAFHDTPKPSHLVGGVHTSEWDSVPSLLASGRTNDPPGNTCGPRISPFLRETSPYMASVTGARAASTPKRTPPATPSVEGKFDASKLKSLSLRDIKYTGFDQPPVFDAANGDEAKDTMQPDREVCFNCWSAGTGNQCSIHTEVSSSASDQGQNLSMCKNWSGTGFLWRKYRSEENHEQFQQSLVFDKGQKEFATAEQSKHPIYRLVSEHIASLNFTYQRRQRVQTWFRSFIKRLKDGKYGGKRSPASAQILLLKSTIKNMAAVKKLSAEVKDQHPQAPVTGTTMKERLGQEQVLVDQVVTINGVDEKRSFVIAGPAPVPKALYRARKYEPLPPAKFVLKDAEVRDHERLDFSSIMTSSVTYAEFGRKRAGGNMAVGGLSSQMVVSRRFTGRFPPQYKNFTCSHDVVLVPPSVNEESPSFPTLDVPPGKLPYVRRELKTPLDSRLPPGVMAKSGLRIDDRHFYGLNRLEQTGEEDDFGFRTSTWYALPPIDGTINTNSFRPSESVATPNVPVLSPMRTMKVDGSYPFCKEQSRQNRVEDLYHFLLSDGACSGNKLQMFTCIGSQQCGYYMQNGDNSLPIGRVVTKVVRSWAFLQSESEENALYDEEQTRLDLGGVVLKHRPRHAESMPRGVLMNNSRKEVRQAILRKMHKEGEALKYTDPHLSANDGGRKADVQVVESPSVDVEKKSVVKSAHVNPQERSKERSSLRNNVAEKSSSNGIARANSNNGISTPNPKVASRQQRDAESLGHCPTSDPTPNPRLEKNEGAMVADSISHVIGETLKSFSAGSPEDLIRLGMGLGASLGAQGFLNLGSAEQKSTTCDDSPLAEQGVSQPGDEANEEVPQLDLDGIDDITIKTCTSEESKLECSSLDNALENNLVNYSDLHPQPTGLLDAIASTRVGAKRVEYLSYTFTLNLPEPRKLGPLKPRSMAEEWKEDGYNPWTDGREPTSSTFIRSLAQETKNWPKPENRMEGPTCSNNAKDFKALCTLCRHGKYRELEDMINDPSWKLPIDYCDDSGNTLLMIACQNGNKRIAKLCLRRGSQINTQNLNGNSCLHFAFGYGFGDLGEYLISKGGDDGLANSSGITCYEFGIDSELEA